MRKLILDVDTGTDDAIAVAMACLSDEFEVLGITTVNGNRGVDYTTENTLRVLDYIGKTTIPVYKGCALPLVSTIQKGRRDNVPIEGKLHDTGLNKYLPLPETGLEEEREPAALWLVNTLLNSDEKITIVAVGPLTNIALAFRIEPSIYQNIEEIVIMGGGHYITNSTMSSEFNIWIDPEAAKIVFDSGAKITLFPLDATHRAFLTPSDCNRLEELRTSAAKMTAEFSRMRIKGYNEKGTMDENDTAPIHDALCVSYLLNPAVAKVMKEGYVEVGILPGVGDGDTVFDFKYVARRGLKPNVNVCLDVDRLLFLESMINCFD